MWKVGLTGPIGSGKSLVAEIFRKLGVPVYHADQEAKRFYNYPVVQNKVRELFGDSVFGPEGIDRKQLAGIVFKDEELLEKLNGLIHPLVKEDFDCWCNLHHQSAYVIHEAALIYESGFEGFFNDIIYVSAPESLRLTRIISRDGVSEEEARARMRFQFREDELHVHSGFILKNDEKQMLLPQVLNLHRRLLDFL